MLSIRSFQHNAADCSGGCRFPVRFALILCALCLGLVLFGVACDRPEQKSSVLQAQIQPEQPSTGFHLETERYTSQSMQLTLRWHGAPPHLEEPPVLAVSLPHLSNPRVQLAGFEVNGKPIENPPQAGELTWSGHLRRWPIYRLEPSAALLDLMREQSSPVRLTFQFEWNNDSATMPAGNQNSAFTGDSSWTQIARAFVINDEGLDRFGLGQPALQQSNNTAPTLPNQWLPDAEAWARLRVTQPGLIRITRDDLIRVGFPSQNLSTDSIRVFYRGHSVPVLTRAQVPALGEGIYFWAQPSESDYTNENIYWITIGSESSLQILPTVDQPQYPDRLPKVDQIQQTIQFNQDEALRTRVDQFQSILAMEWVDRPLEQNQILSIPLDLPDLLRRDEAIQVQLKFFIELLGPISPECIVTFNHNPLASFRFSNVDDNTKQILIPGNLLKEGPANLGFRLSWSGAAPAADATQIWFDQLKINYLAPPQLKDGRLTLAVENNDATGFRWTPLEDLDADPDRLLAFEIGANGIARRRIKPQTDEGRFGIAWPADGGRIEILDPARTVLDPQLEMINGEDLIATDQGADLLVILHPLFREAIGPLIDYHRQAGLQVRTVEIQDIYDQFNHGVFSPEAIASFLRYTITQWRQGAPEAVLLVGDCTKDYLNLARNEVRNWVPSYTYSHGGETWASDYWLSTVIGEDDLGDVIIGRLSVNNPQSLSNVVEKIIQYDRQNYFHPSRARMGYIADLAAGREFSEVVDELRTDATPPQYGAHRIFLDELSLEDNWYLEEDFVLSNQMKVSRQATEAIAETFKQGAALITFYGHGSPNIWSDKRIWFGGDSPNSDNQMLAGTGQYSFVANMSCNTGAIDYPLQPWNVCITEDMMMTPGGGAIGCFVPSGPSNTRLHRRMSYALRESLFQDDLRRLGELTTLARLRFLMRAPNNPKALALAYMYIFQGDPLTELKLARNRARLVTDPSTFQPGQMIPLNVKGIDPARGTWIGELTHKNGRRLWSSSETSYENGNLFAEIPIPADTQPGEATLRFYCWDNTLREEIALAAPLLIEHPYVELNTLKWVDSPSDVSGRQVEIELANPTNLPTTATLQLLWANESTSTSLDEQVVELNGSPVQPFAFDVDLPEVSPQSVLMARVSGASLPPRPDLPRWQQMGIPVMLNDSPRWLSALSQLSVDEGDNLGKLTARAAVSDPGTSWSARLKTATGAILSTNSLTLESIGADQALATLEVVLNRSRRADMINGTIELLKHESTPSVVDRLAFNQVDVARPDLRIIDETIRYEPRNPPEGETIFVQFDVENTGQAPADQITAMLFDDRPDHNARPLTNALHETRIPLPALAPGNRTSLSLRWDPVRNAGAKTIWIYVGNGLPSQVDFNPDVMKSLEVTARTKADLEIGRIWSEADERDRKYNRVTLNLEVRNEGQTEARDIVVSFYRSDIQIPENLLGEVMLDQVPAEGSTVASYTWNYDPAKDLVRGGTLPQPTARVIRKGSVRQPLSSVPASSE